MEYNIFATTNPKKNEETRTGMIFTYQDSTINDWSSVDITIGNPKPKYEIKIEEVKRGGTKRRKLF